MPAPLIDLLRAGVPALLCLVVGIVVIRIVCRRPALRRLSFALSLIALTASVALFRTLVPAEATLLDPYLRFLLLFSLAYGAFKVVEVLVIDLLPGRHGPRQAPAILRDVVAAVVGGLILVVQRLATLGASDYFGEMSLLTGAPRSATIRAVEETRLVVLRKEALRPLLVADPTVLERLSKTLARRQAEREDAIHRAAVSEYESPGGDRAGQLLGRMRRFFGLMGGE
jgi:CRP-like cAMP-binding protein